MNNDSKKTKIKDILTGFTCEKCKNSDIGKLVLYFVLENKILKAFISCMECEGLLEVGVKVEKIGDRLKDIALEPFIGRAG